MIECVYCGWKQVTQIKSNHISIPPSGNDIFPSEELLPEMVDTYKCDMCGFVWKQ